jgi:hypothetical protein
MAFLAPLGVVVARGPVEIQGAENLTVFCFWHTWLSVAINYLGLM